jgi:hypothetical protein
VIWVKPGDTPLLNIALQKGGMNQQPDITGVELALKASQDDAAPFLTTSMGNFSVIGQGASCFFQIAPQFTSGIVDPIIDEFGEEFQDGQQNTSNIVLFAYAQLRFAISQVPPPGTGAALTLYRTSKTFIIAIEANEA